MTEAWMCRGQSHSNGQVGGGLLEGAPTLVWEDIAEF